jgi:hypothetical protein
VLLHLESDSMRVLSWLPACAGSVSALALGGYGWGSLRGFIGRDEEVILAAALAGGVAHFAICRDVGRGSGRARGWHEQPWSALHSRAGWLACAWHPEQPVCALLEPAEVQLVELSWCMASSGSATRESKEVARVPSPVQPAAAAEVQQGCLAWLGGSPGVGSDGHSAAAQLAVTWGPQDLEVLQFGPGAARRGALRA